MTATRMSDSAMKAARAKGDLLPPAVKATGATLPESEKAYFEDRLGHDFSQVRVHTDERAATWAAAFGAKAFATGDNIVFASGRYEPSTTAGRRLLAHELTHVAQQSRGGSGSIGAEPRARAAADQAAAGASVSASAQGEASTGVYCDEDEKKKEAPPAQTATPSPEAAPSDISFGAAGLDLGIPSQFQLKPPTWRPPRFGPGGSSGPGLPPGAEGPLPAPQLRLPSLPLSTRPDPNIDWLSLQYTFGTHGEPMTDQNAKAISDTWEMNKQFLNTIGITDKFKLWFITQDWILNKGMQKQIEDLQARENPNAIDKFNKEFDTFSPDGWKTPILSVDLLDLFRSKKKKK